MFTGAVDAGNLELRAQRRLRKADGNHAVQVVAVALEEIVRPDGEHDVQIALGTAGAARIAFAGSSGCAFLLPRPAAPSHVSLTSLAARAFAAAGRAGIADDRARCRRRRRRCGPRRRIPAGSGSGRGPGTGCKRWARGLRRCRGRCRSRRSQAGESSLRSRCRRSRLQSRWSGRSADRRRAAAARRAGPLPPMLNISPNRSPKMSPISTPPANGTAAESLPRPAPAWP